MEVRDYSEADFEGVCSLYKSARPNFPFLHRDGAFFRYFVSYPGVGDDGVFVAHAAGQIAGVAIISLSEEPDLKIGRIVELWASSEQAVEALTQRALEYCREKSVDIVLVRLPSQSGICRPLRNWTELKWTSLLGKPLSIQPILSALVNSKTLGNLAGVGEITLRIGDEVMKLTASGCAVAVTPLACLTGRPTAQVEMPAGVFLEMVFGQTNPYVAWARGRLKVRGVGNAWRILKILNRIRVGPPHIAFVDHR